MKDENQDMPEAIHNNGGLCERLWNATVAMLDNSRQLQEALIIRDTDNIWEILAEKEAKSAELEQAAELWHQVFEPEKNTANEVLQEARVEIKDKLSRLQSTEKLNYSLTRSYLGAIERTLVKAGAGLAGKKKVYGKGGRLGLKSTSFILDTIG